MPSLCCSGVLGLDKVPIPPHPSTASRQFSKPPLATFLLHNCTLLLHYRPSHLPLRLNFNATIVSNGKTLTKAELQLLRPAACPNTLGSDEGITDITTYTRSLLPRTHACTLDLPLLQLVVYTINTTEFEIMQVNCTFCMFAVGR